MKKKPTILFLFLATSQLLNAQTIEGQTSYYDINFENDWSSIEFEPAENNIWQVGTPSKPILDSAYNTPNALMTDTLNLIGDTAIKHSFILKHERPWWAPCAEDWFFRFVTRYSFDSLNSGGYVEVSYDHGANWTNIMDDNYLDTPCATDRFYTKKDTLFNGDYGISGSQKNWYEFYNSYIWKYVYEGGTWEKAEKLTTAWVKFTYINNGQSEPHEGWLIDNIRFQLTHACEFYSINETVDDDKVYAYPNPANNEIRIKTEENLAGQTHLTIYDIEGHTLLKLNDFCINEPINLNNFQKGYYFFKIENNNKIYKGRFIVNR